MKCEKCNERDAIFFYQKQVNGHTTSVALCSSCAAEAGLIGGKATGDAPLSFLSGDFPNLLGDIFEFSPTKRASADTCEGCGATWRELAKAGKVGCPACYQTFADQLAPGIRAMHGNATHTGRAPAARQAAREKENRVATLKKQLKAAVEGENFEEAARLRDEIRALEREEKG